jgi:hypothetical protein
MEIFIAIIWLVCTAATGDIYRSKGYGVGWGLVVGFMLGPLGLLIAAAKPKKEGEG